MKFFPSQRAVQRAQTRFVVRFFAVMLIVTLVFAAILIGHYRFRLW